MSTRMNLVFFSALLVFVVLYMSVFYVDQRERALVLHLGQIERADYQPGIHFKVPFIEDIKRFDARVLTVDVKPERYITRDKETLLVDSFILWKIKDVAIYYTAMGGDRARATSRIFNIVNNKTYTL